MKRTRTSAKCLRMKNVSAKRTICFSSSNIQICDVFNLLLSLSWLLKLPNVADLTLSSQKRLMAFKVTAGRVKVHEPLKQYKRTKNHCKMPTFYSHSPSRHFFTANSYIKPAMLRKAKMPSPQYTINLKVPSS